MSDAPAVLCRLDDIPDGEGKGFDIGDGGPGIFVVRQGQRLFSYVNDCPHANLTLDFMPDRFMSRDKRHILCANHGALFEIETGACTRGPCRGKLLTPVPVALRDGRVVLADAGRSAS